MKRQSQFWAQGTSSDAQLSSASTTFSNGGRRLARYIHSLRASLQGISFNKGGVISIFGIHSLIFLATAVAASLGCLIVLGASLSGSILIAVGTSIAGTGSLVSMAVWFAETFQLRDRAYVQERNLLGEQSADCMSSWSLPESASGIRPGLRHGPMDDPDEVRKRFELAMDNSNISVFHHDKAHRCTWAYNCKVPLSSLLGRTDDKVMPADSAQTLMKLKSAALESPGVKEAVISINEGTHVSQYLVKTVQNRNLYGKLTGTTTVSFDVTDLKRQEEQLRLVTREVNHRSRNLLSILSGLARRTADNATNMDDFLEKFSSRMQGLSRAHDLILQTEWSAVHLHRLIDKQLSCYRTAGDVAIQLTGPDVELTPKAVQVLSLAFNELATNSVKYGALSAEKGRVVIASELRRSNDQLRLMLSWSESGGPEVKKPERSGFGSFILDKLVASDMGAKVCLVYRPSGLLWHLTLESQYFQTLDDRVRPALRPVTTV